MARERLDVLLVRRGLCPSREKAQRLIMAGEVFSGGTRLVKASQTFPEETPIEVREPDRFVGRGGLKLEAALTQFGIDPSGWTCLDVGASTGGFTDCLLQRGAAMVYALDVGHGQLAWSIRSDPRVVVMEHCNARHLQPGDLPEKVRLAVADVSFISLTLVLPPVAGLLTDGGMMVALIKPQFELSRAEVGRGGVVRDGSAQLRAVDKIRDFAAARGWTWAGVVESPITGADGNREFLCHLLP
ncbi:MAG: TlyA family RNA methyltransferase [Chthoniobacterales bacterium]|nr:TlyA family RNA methyltransferase [Chthoniobacterales bacterium]